MRSPRVEEWERAAMDAVRSPYTAPTVGALALAAGVGYAAWASITAVGERGGEVIDGARDVASAAWMTTPVGFFMGNVRAARLAYLYGQSMVQR